MNKDILHKRIEDALSEIWNTTPEVPLYIERNLQHELRPYQRHALEHFIFIQKQAGSNVLANHLLFHMATGSGKTMVLASTILYLFKEQGYQNFMFFVNSDAIIKKTRDNLTNVNSSKYLFDPNGIEIDGSQVSIQLVDVFPIIPDENTIYLKLTTIQKLHRELEEPRENGLTYAQIEEQPLVLLSDEAHHINVETKAKKKKEKEDTKVIEEKNWESTVTQIMNSNSKNKMLEFTATLDLTQENLFEKYKDKIIYQYDLRRFMNDKYSKNVLLAKTNDDDDSKMLNALLLSQYRKYIAKEIHVDLKPVIMFKSQKIVLSKNARERFFSILDNLTVNLLKEKISRELSLNQGEQNIWEEVFTYYQSSDLNKLIRDLKNDFTFDTVLTVDTQELFSERDALLLNTLEDINNPIRAIFAVAKLNEGWDVLNLYDIVRLSEQASSTKNATDSEAQLIGRGARYYPFKYEGEISFQRRFDENNRRLSILESLHYHTLNESSYIKNLEKSLDAAGIVTREDRVKRFEANIKSKFRKSDLFRNGKIFINRWVKTTEDDYQKFADYDIDNNFQIEFQKSEVTQYGVKNTKKNDEISEFHDEKLILDKRMVYKAIRRNKFFRFNNLKNYIPSISAIKDFVEKSEFLGGTSITVRLPKELTLKNLNPTEKLRFVESFLKHVEEKITKNYVKERGTTEFIGVSFSSLIDDYVIETNVVKTNVNNAHEQLQSYPMRGNDWYIYDQAIVNRLEYDLIKEINAFMNELEKKYKDVYLVRNERKVKFKEFGGVRGFMPDFLLFLKDESATYQVFLEPKGSHLKQVDQWKEEFLLSLNTRPDVKVLHETETIRLIGIKFYSDSRTDRDSFKKDFRNKILPGSEEQFEDGLFSEIHDGKKKG